ncbi:hypothetical protein BDR04DRAFT_295079 [Suillus decipiens]|nr:hypothetical protein BDR04DRAFT_295079 [Suillus decipiens]
MSTSPPSENLVRAVKQVGDIRSNDSSDLNANQIVISSISADEPIMTRRELWSYYLYSNGGNVSQSGIRVSTYFICHQTRVLVWTIRRPYSKGLPRQQAMILLQALAHHVLQPLLLANA